VQREAGNFDAARGERVEDLRSEVQAGGGRGDGAAFAGEDRLVALAVGGGIVAADVGRQRDVADAVERGEKIIDRLETQQALAELAALQHLGFERDGAVGRGKDENLADGDFPSRTDEGAPEVFAGRLGQKDFEWMPVCCVDSQVPKSRSGAPNILLRRA
jgi:hypothetical protein